MESVREFVDYVAISAGMALAVSCYVVIGGMFSLSYGYAIPLAIALAGCICLVVSLSVAELSSRFPSAPGIRTYLKAAFGNSVSLVLVFMYLSMIALVAGVESYAFSEIVLRLGFDVPRALSAATLIIFIIAINLAGVEVAKQFQTFCTGILIVSMIVISIYGLVSTMGSESASGAYVAHAKSLDTEHLAALMGMAVFLFVGFEWVTPMGKRPDSYQRLLPLSMPAAIIVLAVLYVVFSTAFLHTAPQQHSLNAPQLSLGDALFGRAGVMVMMGLSLLAMLTSFNAGLMGAARLVYGIAREGHLPKMCSRISLNTCAPVGAIAALGGVSLLAALVAGFYQLHLAMAVVAAVITAMVYGAVIFAMLVLRRQSHHKPAIFRNPMPAPVLWVTGALFVLLAPATLVTDSPPYSGLLLAAITVLAGLLSRWSKFEALWQTRWVKDTPI